MNWGYKGGRISKRQEKWERWKQMKHDKAITPAIELNMGGSWLKKKKTKKITLYEKQFTIFQSAVIPRLKCDLKMLIHCSSWSIAFGNVFCSYIYLHFLCALAIHQIDRMHKERWQTQSSHFSVRRKGKTSQLLSRHIIYCLPSQYFLTLMNRMQIHFLQLHICISKATRGGVISTASRYIRTLHEDCTDTETTHSSETATTKIQQPSSKLGAAWSMNKHTSVCVLSMKSSY